MSLDRIFVSIKIGDNGQYQDGMLIDYFDELETGIDFEKALTPDCSKKFRFVQIDRRMKPKIVELLSPVGYAKILDPMGLPIPDPDLYKVRGGILPFVDLASFCKVSITELRDQINAKAPLNGLLLGEEIFKSSLLIKPEGISDKASIAGGNCTVGSGGAAPNYLTWALFGSDIATLTSNLTATQVANTAETAQCAINVALAGFTLTLTSNTNPLGNFGAGWLTTTPSIGNNVAWLALTCSSVSPGAIIALSNLNLKMLDTNLYPMEVGLYSNTANIINKINDCLINGNGKNCLGAVKLMAINTIVQMFNCVLVGGHSGGLYAAGIYNLASTNTASIFSNITVYDFTATIQNGGFLNYLNTAFTIKNLACFGNTLDFCYGSSFTPGVGNALASKCASSDATGSEAGLRSLVTANQFQSTTLTDGDLYLKLKEGATLLETGVAPGIAENTYGIRGNARPHGALYSIGADEAVAVKSGFPYAMFMKGA